MIEIIDHRERQLGEGLTRQDRDARWQALVIGTGCCPTA